MAGGIPQHILGWLRRDIPPSDTPSLLRQLRYTLLEHQFQTWALRNEAQPIRDHRPSYARPRRPPFSPQKAQPKPLRKKRKRRSKEDTWEPAPRVLEAIEILPHAQAAPSQRGATTQHQAQTGRGSLPPECTKTPPVRPRWRRRRLTSPTKPHTTTLYFTT